MKPIFYFSLFVSILSIYRGTHEGQASQFIERNQVPEGLAKSDWQSIRAAYEAERHAFQPVATGWQARNPGQQWITKFDGRGFLAEPRDSGWQWGLELQSYGFPGAERTVGGVPAMKADGQRLTYDWDAAVQEWFINDTRGLEHGFTVTERPPGSSQQAMLNFQIATRGILRPVITSDAKGVHFLDRDGATVIHYTGLRVWDADGRALASRFEAAGENSVRLLVEESGARYPITVDPVAQQAFLKPAAVGSTQAGDVFGTSVAVSGNTVVVGAPGEDSGTTGVNSTPNENASFAGAAYVFVRNGTAWTQQAYLKASNAGVDDRFGTSVAISGDTIVVGAPEEDSSTTGVNSTPNESAALAGAAYVFTRSGTTWSQQAYLKSGNTGAGDQFGTSVSVSGNYVVVGAWREDSSTPGVNSTPNESAMDAGAAYVFTRSGSTWSQQAYLKAGNPGTIDSFGRAVAISGDTVVVGAQLEDSSTTGINSTPNESSPDSGAAYVFTRNGSTWTQQAYVKPGNTGSSDNFGASVAVSGDAMVVGAPNEDGSTTGVNSTPDNGGNNTGAAYVFARSGTVWTQQAYLKASNTGNADLFGISVGVSGDTVVAGARGEASSTTGIDSTSNEAAPNAGAAYVFTRRGSVWSQLSYLKAGHTSSGDFFGGAVAVSGDLAVVGAIGEDSSTTGVNAVPNESSGDSGGAFVFALPNPVLEFPTGVRLSETDGTVDLGNVATGASGVPQTFTVRNLGAAALTGLTLSAEGLNAGDFIVSAPTATTVPADGTVTFTVNFAPVVPDFRTATLSVRVDGEPLPRTSVRLVGHGLGPELISAVQQAYLKPAAVGTDQAGDALGWAVAVSGNTVVVGAPAERSDTAGVNSTPNENAPGAGAAYVFVRNGATWTQQAYLKAGNPQAGDAFGRAVAISGDIIVVGADGEDSSTTDVNSVPDELAPGAGAAYVFVRNGTTWTQQAYLKASDFSGSSKSFGEAVAVSGETVAVASYVTGTVDVFARSGGTWTRQTQIADGPSDAFGFSLAISGDTLVVGAFEEDSDSTGVNSTPNTNAEDAGAAYVFFRRGTEWTLQAYLKASNTGAEDWFGISVAVSGDTVVVGAINEDGSSPGINGIPNDSPSHGNSGAAYVFTRNGTSWTQQAYVKTSSPMLNQWFGRYVGLSGDTMVVGAAGGAVPTAYVFHRSGVIWTQAQEVPFPPGSTETRFPAAVSGDTLVMGARFDDSATTGVNTTPDTNAENSGAAYIFAPDTPEIAVEQPAGSEVVSGGDRSVIAAVGSHSDVPFTVRNLSTVPLLLMGVPPVTVSGPDAALFSVTTQADSPVNPGTPTSFVVRFAPTTDGLKSAILTVASDDPDEGTYTIQLAGTALSPLVDTDGDGLNDAAEFQMAALGFDWEVAQPELVETLMANADYAGLFTTAQVQALNIDAPLLQRDATTGRFTLTIGVRKSTTLAPDSFLHFPFTVPGISINGAGKMEFEFTVPDDAAFFLLQAQ